MGFWSTVGDMAVAGAQKAQAATSEAKELAMVWEREDDSFLVRKFKSGSMTEKMAATAALKAKYPDDNERKRRMQNHM